MKKTKVVFIYGKNRARSQMAEAFLRRYANEGYEVHSAGLEHSEIHPMTIKVMNEIGYDLSDHYSKNLKHFLGREHFAYVITVCDRAKEKCPTFPGGTFHLHWGDLDDPVAFEGTEEEKLETFRRIRDRVVNWLKDWGEEIKE